MTAILTPQPLLSDEKAWSLFEDNKVTPDGKSIHRYQLLRVIRNDRVVEFERDMGNALFYDVEPFYIPSYLMLSVAHVLEQAELLRRDGTGIQKAMDDHRAEFNPITAMITHVEQATDFIKRNPRTVETLKRQLQK